MRLQIILPVLLAAALGACQPAPADKTGADAAASVSGPALGAFTTPARIISMSDAGYPMFVVVAQFPDRATPVELLLNAEDVDLGDIEREQYVGKDVTLGYAVVAENNLFDLRDGDLSLVPEAPARAAHWKEVTGVLSGAETATISDLPDTIAVTDESGTRFDFEYYVTPELAAANGKPVTAWYSPSTAQYVKSLRLAAATAK